MVISEVIQGDIFNVNIVGVKCCYVGCIATITKKTGNSLKKKVKRKLNVNHSKLKANTYKNPPAYASDHSGAPPHDTPSVSPSQYVGKCGRYF